MRPPQARASDIDVVAFAPHPDDVELFCGGTMLVAAARGLRTAIVDMTEGELSTNGDLARRSRERATASGLLCLSARISLGLPDGSLGADEAHRAAAVQAIRELTPQVVLAPYGDDRHPDHAAAARLLKEACFLAGVARYGRGSPHRPQRVYWYMLHTLFDPAVVIDVGSVWDRRRQLLRVYESQVARDEQAEPTPLNDGRFIAMLEARAVTFGAMAGVTQGEPLHVDGPLLLQSLPEWGAASAATGPYQAQL